MQNTIELLSLLNYHVLEIERVRDSLNAVGLFVPADKLDHHARNLTDCIQAIREDLKKESATSLQIAQDQVGLMFSGLLNKCEKSRGKNKCSSRKKN